MSVATAPRFPGIPAVVDGSEAIADVEIRISEGACAYPITPSTNMAYAFQAAVADGGTNLWPGPEMVETQADRLANWRLLQELARVR